MSDPRDALYCTESMAAVWSPAVHVSQLLAFEAALARAEAHVGVIPHAAADAINAACTTTPVDIALLYRQAAQAGTLVIPLLDALRPHIAEAGRTFLHWGATSQDAIDTALMLQSRTGLDLLDADLRRLAEVCATLAEQHRTTLMAGRTLLQQALPISLGLKAARWLGLLTRQIQALHNQRQQLAVQFGGAAGTLATLGSNGMRVAEILATELELVLPDLPWHAERDRVASLASVLGITAGAMAKIAQDLVLLAQTEVGEVSEGSAIGKGGSSAMPHKHNPVDAIFALSAAKLAIGQVPIIIGAMTHEHERAAGSWQAEWQALPDLFRYTSGAVARVADAVTNLQIDAARMRANLDLNHGLLMSESLTMALATQMGRPTAQRLVQEIIRRVLASGNTFQQAAQADPQIQALLSTEALEQALDPAGYLGSTEQLIDRALAGHRAVVVKQD